MDLRATTNIYINIYIWTIVFFVKKSISRKTSCKLFEFCEIFGVFVLRSLCLFCFIWLNHKLNTTELLLFFFSYFFLFCFSECKWISMNESIEKEEKGINFLLWFWGERYHIDSIIDTWKLKERLLCTRIHAPSKKYWHSSAANLQMLNLFVYYNMYKFYT